MPQFGVCTGPEKSQIVKDAGFTYVEASVQAFFEGRKSDAEYAGVDAYTSSSVLPIPACNMLVPGDLKITGPDVDREALKSYITHVCRRAGQAGVKVLVFGSGAARNVPEGFGRGEANRQILDFLQIAAPCADNEDVTLVIEPLNKGECNIINSVAEAMEYVREAGYPGVQCLVDSYHLWLENEPLSHLEAAMPHIKHVHVADRDGRTAPGQNLAGTDYAAFMRVLKRGGYDGMISIEGNWTPESLAPALELLRNTWESA